VLKQGRNVVIAAGLLAVSSMAFGHSGSAHEPSFQNRQLWPWLSGKEYFVRETWPKGRLLVWAHPGKSGGKRFRGALDVTDPANWLEDGKPARELVLDENTDLLFPASKERYYVGFRGTDVREVCRHLTIESGASFVGGGDGVGRSIYGSVWVEDGGGMDAQGATRFMGSRHTFFRNDNTLKTARSTSRGGGIMSSQYFTFNKENHASVEFLGHVSVLDELRVYGCTVIVGPDSILQPGRNASPTIYQGGILALMDGARFESWNNDFGTPELTVTAGFIQGGLVDRPLKRSCWFGLAFKNHTNATHEDADEKTRSRRLVRVPSLVVTAGALRSYTTDPTKARLVFTVMENQDICPRPGTEDYKKSIGRRPQNEALCEWMMKLPRGTDCFLAKGVKVENVEFDHLRKGGLMCADIDAVKSSRNLFFGLNCMAEQSELFSVLESVERNCRY